MNEILQKVVVTVAIVGGILTQSTCIAMLVGTLKENKSWMEIGMAIAVFLNGVTVLAFLLGGLAQVNATSKTTLIKLRKHLAKKGKVGRGKICPERIYLHSFPCIKVQFGDLNYLESLTPLKCVDYANSVAAQLLMLGERL